MSDFVGRTWKSALIGAMILLALTGITIALFNLPVVSGYVPG